MLNAQCDAALRRKHIRHLLLGENDLVDRILLMFEVRKIIVNVGREEHLCEWRVLAYKIELCFQRRLFTKVPVEALRRFDASNLQ